MNTYTDLTLFELETEGEQKWSLVHNGPILYLTGEQDTAIAVCQAFADKVGASLRVEHLPESYWREKFAKYASMALPGEVT